MDALRRQQQTSPSPSPAPSPSPSPSPSPQRDYSGANSMYLYDCPYCMIPVWVGRGSQPEYVFNDRGATLGIIHRTRWEHFLYTVSRRMDEQDRSMSSTAVFYNDKALGQLFYVRAVP